ncbi:protein kinase domain-containing protein [Trichoderma breve]|uniref:cAMP-dependent protein kinase n=1 Tax=Trichoderma breve TaxID=2034170 RepID=A0A9W9BDC1_9HYPO|nr:protein kinase domain-containing protein [Trichoderma breve]KAJ4860402.1 protein kinase domain-containing protein [Trichoderma breve]
MPSFGSFLKKKRTKEGSSDPSAKASTSTSNGNSLSTANPTSPVAPTPGSRHLDSTQPRVTPGSSTSATAATATTGDSNHAASASGQQASTLAPAPATAAAARDPATAVPPTAAPDPDRQPAMNPVNVQSPHSYAPGHDSQNLPSISNLINSPQNDGSTNGYPPSPYQNSAAVGSQMADQNAQLQQQQLLQQQQQQQQQHLSSEMQLDPPHQQQQQQPQQQQPQQQPPQQQQQQQQQPQQHHQIHHGHSVSLSQPRVTKGKYSLGDFEILRTLGTGSFGRVHLVQSKHNQRFYAVKVLKKAQVVKMKQVEHTNDERRMLSDVKHPFLITLWGTFQDWKNLYMVMDFVEGGELFSLLRKSGRFPNPVAKFYAAEATLALEYLHSKNIIYRDLKPENLLLDRHGHLKITDFGFAKRVPDKTWTLCGTPDYLAPEVVSNKGYNKSVDWWSLGILIYEMLCGYTPFWDSGSPMRIYENILKGKVKYPAYINPDAQNLLERLITADLTKRLGNLFGGSQDVRNHPWFAEVTWDRLARKDIDAPYTPPVKAGAGDASQFDRYPEDPEKYGGPGGHDEYGNLFTEF